MIVETKFNVGDRITRKNKLFTIDRINIENDGKVNVWYYTPLDEDNSQTGYLESNDY